MVLKGVISKSLGVEFLEIIKLKNITLIQKIVDSLTDILISTLNFRDQDNIISDRETYPARLLVQLEELREILELIL